MFKNNKLPKVLYNISNMCVMFTELLLVSSVPV